MIEHRKTLSIFVFAFGFSVELFNNFTDQINSLIVHQSHKAHEKLKK